MTEDSYEQGMRVPDDVSVTTFSNAYPVEDTIPPLTTIALPTVEMGRAAAELLIEQIESNGSADNTIIAMCLMYAKRWILPGSRLGIH